MEELLRRGGGNTALLTISDMSGRQKRNDV